MPQSEGGIRPLSRLFEASRYVKFLSGANDSREPVRFCESNHLRTNTLCRKRVEMGWVELRKRR